MKPVEKQTLAVAACGLGSIPAPADAERPPSRANLMSIPR